MRYRVVLHVLLAATGFIFFASCAGAPGTGTPIYKTQQGDETFTFGLPSTETYAITGVEAKFKDGMKIPNNRNIIPDAILNSAGAHPQDDGAESIIRDWKVIYDTFYGTYSLRSGEWMEIDFPDKYKKVHPTVATLRHIFGKWIIFKGDDMSRVREVTAGLGIKVLIFNDGRLPTDTYAPDYH